MAYLTLNRDKLRHNYRLLNDLFNQHDIRWGVVTKLLCGNTTFLQEILALNPYEVMDSRVSNLRKIKALAPQMRTVYIKPPAMRSIAEVVRYADVSLNSELATIQALSAEAVQQGKQHEIIIMLEMGDLREGVMREDVVTFYQEVYRLPAIKVIGLGTNLNCLSGTLPSEDKLIQLGLYKKIVELSHQVELPLISAGTSVTIPLLYLNQVPRSVNHFRVGDSLYFGNDIMAQGDLAGFHQDVFELHAEVIEVAKKPMIPSGVLAPNPQGNQADLQPERAESTRVILDIGVLDIQPGYLVPELESLNIIEASSDMVILDAGDNRHNICVGDSISFKLNYMATLSLMNSHYIDKYVIENRLEETEIRELVGA